MSIYTSALLKRRLTNIFQKSLRCFTFCWNGTIVQIDLYSCPIFPTWFHLFYSINLEHNNLVSFSGLINLPNLRVSKSLSGIWSIPIKSKLLNICLICNSVYVQNYRQFVYNWGREREYWTQYLKVSIFSNKKKYI